MVFNAQTIGNALYGLRAMRDSPDTRKLVVALTPKVVQCRQEMSGQNIGNALYGLQQLKDSEEVPRQGAGSVVSLGVF